MGVRVDPSSMDYVEMDGKLMSRSKGSMAVRCFLFSFDFAFSCIGCGWWSGDHLHIQREI